ncbi:hypothetical protein C2E23DRAFT_860822 [Lenzites betulinus]|nr:hypothetical protein C2E23DRAFT_860822 [Lenzites betulinus]
MTRSGAQASPPLTYAQVAASPPSTPIMSANRAMRSPPAVATHKPTAQHATKSRNGGTTVRDGTVGLGLVLPTENTTASPQQGRDTPTPTTVREKTGTKTGGTTQTRRNAVEDETAEERAASPATEYLFDDMDMDALEESLQEPVRRYGSPTSEDWRNLSVHAESVDSDDLAGAIGESIGRDKVDLENFITNGIDRYGDTIPGQEQWREEYRARKRPRAGSPAQDTDLPRVHSVRFRRYRTKQVGHKPRDPNSTSTGTTDLSLNAPALHENTATITPDAPPNIHSAARPSATDKGKAPERHATHYGLNYGPPPETPHAPRTILEPPASYMEIDDALDQEHLPQPQGHRDDRAPITGTGNTLLHDTTTAGAEGYSDGPRRTPDIRPGGALIEILPSFLTQPSTTQRDRGGSARPMTAEAGAPPHVTPTTPGADGYGFTPEPTEGFPSIHQAHPEGLIEDLALSRIDEAWKQREGTVLFVQIANVGHPDVPLRKPLHDEIYAAIRHVTGKTDFVPIAPQPEWVQPPRRAGAPKTWMVFGLDEEDVAELVRLKILSCVWITLFFYERKLVIPKYLFTLTGYTTNHDDDIVSSIRGAFLNDPIFSTIADLVLSHPGLQHLSQHEAAMRIATSVDVRVDQLGNGNMQAAVFCDSPTGSGESWKIWRGNLMKMPFHSRFNPTAVARRIELCLCCHSADHVTHKCPFQHIPGWNAPPPLSRTHGRPRQQPPTNTEAQGYPPSPGNQGSYRGRARGSGLQRGGRASTPMRNPYYIGP